MLTRAASIVVRFAPQLSSHGREAVTMKDDWERKYRVALMERNPALQQLRVEDAYQAVIRRMNETDDNGDEQHKLERAIDMLSLLRNRI